MNIVTISSLISGTTLPPIREINDLSKKSQKPMPTNNLRDYAVCRFEQETTKTKERKLNFTIQIELVNKCFFDASHRAQMVQKIGPLIKTSRPFMLILFAKATGRESAAFYPID